MNKLDIKNHQFLIQVKTGLQQEVQRNMRAWLGLYGVLKGKIGNPAQWQRKIRKEWQRKVS